MQLHKLCLIAIIFKAARAHSTPLLPCLPPARDVYKRQVAEFMGVKIFSLEDSLGIGRMTFDIFGEKIEGFSLTCGILLWPFVFVMTDIINEYFGTKGVRFLSMLGAFMIGYAFLMLTLGMNTAPASWWISSSDFGTSLNYENAYDAVFGQGSSIIVGSILAFMIGQLVDVYLSLIHI